MGPARTEDSALGGADTGAAPLGGADSGVVDLGGAKSGAAVLGIAEAGWAPTTWVIAPGVRTGVADPLVVVALALGVDVTNLGMTELALADEVVRACAGCFDWRGVEAALPADPDGLDPPAAAVLGVRLPLAVGGLGARLPLAAVGAFPPLVTVEVGLARLTDVLVLTRGAGLVAKRASLSLSSYQQLYQLIFMHILFLFDPINIQSVKLKILYSTTNYNPYL